MDIKQITVQTEDSSICSFSFVPSNWPKTTLYGLYDPLRGYTLDHFGSEEVMIEFWKQIEQWAPRREWKDKAKRMIGLKFDGKKRELVQIYFYGFWNTRILT